MHYWREYSSKLSDLILKPVKEFGDVVIFSGRIVGTIPQIPRSSKLIFNSMLEIGVRSLPIVFVISIFAGATTAWQANYQLEGFVSMRYLGTAVTKSILLELGPVLTGLVVAGRIGASIAASLASERCKRPRRSYQADRQPEGTIGHRPSFSKTPTTSVR